MLAEMIEKIVGLSREGQTFKTLEEPGGKWVRIKNPDGKVDRVIVPPSDRQYVAQDLDTLAAMLKGSGNAAVFVRGNGIRAGVNVIAFLDEEVRNESVRFEVAPSVARTTLLSLAETWQKQRAFVQALRDDLWGCCAPDLLDKMRTLDFTRRNDGSKSIQHGRESLGNSIEEQVQSKHGKLPEVVELDLPWFGTMGFEKLRNRIEVSLDTDATNEVLRFAPRGDEMELANQDSVAYVADQIRTVVEETTRVFIGSPDPTSN